MKICRLMMCFTIAIAMTVTMIPWPGGAANIVYAETATANGGSVLSNSVENVKAAFGSENVIVEHNDQNIAITLQKDISLLAPVLFQRGEEGDIVTLNLNGHTIYGPAGESGTNRDSAIGKNAIEIIPADFNVVIQGEGSVIGGRGAVYESEYHKKYGMDGGEAVSFTGTGDMSDYWYPDSDDAELKYGLTVNGGAILTGGAGADMKGDDWVYNIREYNGPTEHEMSNNPQFTLSAGAGGAGIGQTDTGIEYGASTLAYTKIEINNGTVTGGKGGSIDLGTKSTPILTHYSLMTSEVIDQYMKELSNTSNTYDDYVANAISFVPGDGGDGIMIGAGRKYLCTEQAATVSGGSCGIVEYKISKRISRFGCETAESGDGIGIFGDIGLKNVDVNISESNWESKTKASDDMGVYIAGTVKGGDSQKAIAMNEASGNAGDGIVIHDGKMHSKYEYSNTGSLPFPDGEEYVKWGIVEIDAAGRVSGGNAGISVCGSPGSGGDGICESYTKGDESSSPYGTDYYIIKGIVEGGNGGDSHSGVSGGGPGNGLSFGNYRKYANVLGNGTAAGGDYGRSVNRNGGSDYGETDAAEGIRFYPANRADLNNTVMDSVKETAGGSSGQQINIDNTGLSAMASMSSFSSVPTTSTMLACNVTRPSGYIGVFYIKWFAELNLQSDTTVCDIEPSGSTCDQFCMRCDSQYKYLAYPINSYHPEYGYRYNMAIATTDRIGYVLKHSNSYVKIWCEVQLDDGRWTKSNVMTVKSGEGWNDSSPKAVTPSVTLSAKKYTYNAKTRKPGVTVKVGAEKLAQAQYTVSYAAGRKNVGTYKVTVNLKGNYKGTKAASFTIVPKGATIVKPKPAKKALTIKWKKQSAKMAKNRITGYQIQCSTSKSFKSGVKKKTVKGYKKTSVTVSKLKAKKTYYVRVRTYMKTGGKTYCSNWSKVLKTKTK